MGSFDSAPYQVTLTFTPTAPRPGNQGFTRESPFVSEVIDLTVGEIVVFMGADSSRMSFGLFSVAAAFPRGLATRDLSGFRSAARPPCCDEGP